MNGNVLVVGAGPVGLTMACELARYQVPIRIVDKAPQRTDKSKAIVLWSRTLELLDRGAETSRPFLEGGFKVHNVNFIASDGAVVGRVGMDSVKSPYPYALMLPQSDTERLLEERLRAMGIEVERNTEVTALTTDGLGVEASLRRGDGSAENVHADWLVGCDGAHSVVRHALGAPFTGTTMDSDWILADVHMRGYQFPDDEVAVYWARDGVLPIFPISPGRYRVLANIPPTGAEHPLTPTLEEVQAILDRRGAKGAVAFDPIWLAGFRINARKVAKYRAGRVFLTGDAAHVHSPAGGEGMNTGMQDSFNLAWKLALVARGLCADSLLDSYSAERSEVGEEVLKSSARLTAVGTLRNPIAEELRNIVGHFALGLAPVQHAFADKMTQVSVGYPNSPLNGGSFGSHGPRPGERVEPRRGEAPFGVGDAPRFALLASPSQTASDLLARFPWLFESAARPPPDPNGVWLVRPDGYVSTVASATDLRVISDVLQQTSR
jgi:2-polyprenyl-6-methoxyphenol hydroxylase-like FAD-dependent oxidoreductase